MRSKWEQAKRNFVNPLAKTKTHLFRSFYTPAYFVLTHAFLIVWKFLVVELPVLLKQNADYFFSALIRAFRRDILRAAAFLCSRPFATPRMICGCATL